MGEEVGTLVGRHVGGFEIERDEGWLRSRGHGRGAVMGPGVGARELLGVRVGVGREKRKSWV